MTLHPIEQVNIRSSACREAMGDGFSQGLRRKSSLEFSTASERSRPIESLGCTSSAANLREESEAFAGHLRPPAERMLRSGREQEGIDEERRIKTRHIIRSYKIYYSI